MFRNFAACLLISTLIGCGSGGGVSSGGGVVGGGGGAGGGAFPGGGANIGADTPGAALPPGGFPDGGFVGGGSSMISIIVNGILSATGLRGTTDFAVGIGEGSLSEVKVTINNATSVQFIAQAGANFLAGAVLKGPDTTLVGLMSPTGGPQQTAAVFLDTSINSMPYTTSGLDPAIISGDEYRYQIISSGSPAETITGTVIAKNDLSPLFGTLRVRIFLVGSIAQSSDDRIAVNQAIEVWRQIYAAAGITLDVTVEDIASGTGILPAPNVGSAFYAANAATSRPYTLNLYVGSGISMTSDTSPGNTFPNELLGIAASIPGPAVPTIKSAVAINILTHSGVDGVFSNSEVELLGSTMAHESGHYLGLFHVVEFAGDDDDAYLPGDLFVDTPLCVVTSGCIANGAAANLMFPAAIPGQNEQRDLSPSQRIVLNSQILVD